MKFRYRNLALALSLSGLLAFTGCTATNSAHRANRLGMDDGANARVVTTADRNAGNTGRSVTRAANRAVDNTVGTAGRAVDNTVGRVAGRTTGDADSFVNSGTTNARAAQVAGRVDGVNIARGSGPRATRNTGAAVVDRSLNQEVSREIAAGTSTRSASRTRATNYNTTRNNSNTTKNSLGKSSVVKTAVKPVASAAKQDPSAQVRSAATRQAMPRANQAALPTPNSATQKTTTKPASKTALTRNTASASKTSGTTKETAKVTKSTRATKATPNHKAKTAAKPAQKTAPKATAKTTHRATAAVKPVQKANHQAKAAESHAVVRTAPNFNHNVAAAYQAAVTRSAQTARPTQHTNAGSSIAMIDGKPVFLGNKTTGRTQEGLQYDVAENLNRQFAAEREANLNTAREKASVANKYQHTRGYHAADVSQARHGNPNAAANAKSRIEGQSALRSASRTSGTTQNRIVAAAPSNSFSIDAGVGNVDYMQDTTAQVQDNVSNTVPFVIGTPVPVNPEPSSVIRHRGHSGATERITIVDGPGNDVYILDQHGRDVYEVENEQSERPFGVQRPERSERTTRPTRPVRVRDTNDQLPGNLDKNNLIPRPVNVDKNKLNMDKNFLNNGKDDNSPVILPAEVPKKPETPSEPGVKPVTPIAPLPEPQPITPTVPVAPVSANDSKPVAPSAPVAPAVPAPNASPAPSPKAS